jgi:hypothetical protein
MKRFKAIKFWVMVWLRSTLVALFVALVLFGLTNIPLFWVGACYLVERILLLVFASIKFDSEYATAYELKVRNIALEKENWELERTLKAMNIALQNAEQAASLPV